MNLPHPGARPNTGGGGRPTTSGGDRPTTANWSRAPALHRQGPVGLGTSDFYYRFFITYRNNEPVIYEYRGGNDFSPTLEYPQKDPQFKKLNRNYYRKGDMIFICSVDQKSLARRFPTLARKDGDKTFLEKLIESEILGPVSSYVVAQKIVKIEPVLGKPGYGIVYTKPVIFYGKTAVDLSDERESSFSVMQMTHELPFTKLAVSLNSILPLIYFTMEVLQMVMTGVAKAAVSRGMAVYVARQGALHLAAGVAKKEAGKAVLKAMLSNGLAASSKATLEFVKVFLKKAGEADVEEKLRKQTSAKEKVDYHALSNAIKDASIAFSVKFVDECLGSLVGSMARQLGVDKALKEYISKKIISLVTTEPTNAAIGAYRKAVLEKERKQLGNKAAAAQSMANELTNWFWNYLKGLLKDAVGAATA
jgi:hypothetical protein